MTPTPTACKSTRTASAMMARASPRTRARRASLRTAITASAPAHIEHALRTQPGVDEAVVLVHGEALVAANALQRRAR